MYREQVYTKLRANQVTHATISQQHSQANKNGVPHFHCDLSLALDDRVDYVEVRLLISLKTTIISREVRRFDSLCCGVINFLIVNLIDVDDFMDVNLDSLLIHLRSHVTPM